MSFAVLWCSKEECDLQDKQIIFWQKFITVEMETAGRFSLPDLVFKESDHWKSEYLDWINELGFRVSGVDKLGRTLEVAPGLNYWWMTLPLDPSFSVDSLAYTMTRLWALDRMAGQLNLSQLEVYGADSYLISILLEWGAKSRVKILIRDEQFRSSSRRSVLEVLRTSSALPILIFSGIGTLSKQFFQKRVWAVWQRTADALVRADLVLVDYFANVGVDSNSEIKFQSNYWGKLPEALAEENVSVHWIHIYVQTPSIPDYSEAKKVIMELNKNNAHQVHSLLQEHISFQVFLTALRNYLRIIRLGLRVKEPEIQEFYDANKIGMSRSIRQRLRRAYLGAPAAQNAIWLAVFADLFKRGQSLGPCLYLMENQPWELALLSNWRAYSKYSIYGVPHSTIRSWDLRYAVGSRSRFPNSPPRPDQALVNGPASIHQLLANGIDARHLQQVEALRYIGIRQRFQQVPKGSSSRDATTRLLVFGEFEESMIAAQIELLNSLIEAYGEPLQIVFRPHPAAKMPKVLLDTRIQFDASAKMSLQLAQSDVGLCGSVSSALVDILLSGTPAIILRNGSFLDGRIIDDPLVQSVIDLTGTIAAIHTLSENKLEVNSLAEELFDLDPDIPKWKLFLSSLN